MPKAKIHLSENTLPLLKKKKKLKIPHPKKPKKKKTLIPKNLIKNLKQKPRPAHPQGDEGEGVVDGAALHEAVHADHDPGVRAGHGQELHRRQHQMHHRIRQAGAQGHRDLLLHRLHLHHRRSRCPHGASWRRSQRPENQRRRRERGTRQ